MARKVINTTHSANYYDILSQTPKNYDEHNYFLKELQDKINAEWEYRPNRVDIEFENDWGKQEYSPIEVVIQSVKSEKGTAISDDCRRIVFRDILDRRFKIGSRFRFGQFVGGVPSCISDEEKNVWLSTNTDSVKMTSSMIIERCNGTLGSLYVDSQGISHYHYEPVIQHRDLSAVNFIYNEAAVSPQAQLEIIAQHNDYTRDYFINQRFIVGYDRVYRIKAINKFYSGSTFNPENVGLIKIYLELTEKSQYDDFKNRIAYQGKDSVIIHDKEGGEASSTIKFITPEVIPSSLTEEPVMFTPIVIGAGNEQDLTKSVKFSCVLKNLPAEVNIDNYVNIIEGADSVTISRNRIYFRGDLILTWEIIDNNGSPTGEVMSFAVSLRE